MSLQIILDNYNGACYPGETLAGRIECVLNTEKNLRALRIKFKGATETEWHESQSHYNSATKKNESRRVRYSAEEIYFEQEYILVQGGDNFSLPPGRHVYPFSYILPQQLPSSFEGGYGHVRYTIKATVDRPWKFDYETKIQLNLISPLDLNYLPGARDPMATTVDKSLCCWWCKSGPISLDISLPVKGFCPGQEVNIGAYVQNLSNVSAENVKFKIYKDIEFIAHYPSTRHRHQGLVVNECCDGGIGAHGEHSWTSTLLIPSNDLYPNLIPCSLINISYRLTAKIVLPCPHSNLVVELPLFIGTVPLTGAPPATILGPPSSEHPLPAYPGPQPMPYPPGSTMGDPTAPRPSEDAPLLTFPLPSSGPATSAPYPVGPTVGAPPLGPSPTNVPYPPPSASGGAPYPPTAAPPYPSALGANDKVPYPTGDASPYPSAPGASAPYPTGGGKTLSSDATAPPSYDEAKQLKEKN